MSARTGPQDAAQASRVTVPLGNSISAVSPGQDLPSYEVGNYGRAGVEPKGGASRGRPIPFKVERTCEPLLGPPP